jgi:rRNA maturation RNase YbeY
MISLEKAYEEAHLFYHGKSDHLLFLLIHGILHLLGYDHEESRNEEARMKRRERKIFEKIYVGRKNVPKSSP